MTYVNSQSDTEEIVAVAYKAYLLLRWHDVPETRLMERARALTQVLICNFSITKIPYKPFNMTEFEGTILLSTLVDLVMDVSDQLIDSDFNSLSMSTLSTLNATIIACLLQEFEFTLFSQGDLN